jgi:hypothetical protein
MEYVSGATVGTGATAQPLARFNGSGTPMAAPNALTTGNYQGEATLWSEADNRITGGGFSQIAFNDGGGTAEKVASDADFNASRELQFGYDPSVGDSSKVWGYGFTELELSYPQ